MYLCIYVSMYLCIYLYAYIYIYIYICIYIYIYIYIYIVYIYIYICIHKYMYIWTSYVYMCAWYVHIYIHDLYIDIYIHTCWGGAGADQEARRSRCVLPPFLLCMILHFLYSPPTFSARAFEDSAWFGAEACRSSRVPPCRGTSLTRKRSPPWDPPGTP